MPVKTIKMKARTFWRMTFQLKLMFFINFFLCGIARFLSYNLALPRLLPHFGQFYDQLIMSTLISTKQRNQALLIKRSITLAAKYTPWNSNCLTQAIVATFWCKRWRIPYMLYIGLRRSAEHASGYLAHAWTTAGPVPMTGGNCLHTYKVISTYSSIA